MKPIDRNAVKIRRMVSSDITPTLGIWWANIPNKEVVASQLRGPLDLSFIAEYEGLLVGFILAKLVYAGMPMTGVGVIFLIAVNPDYQERGIGSMLIDTLKNHCKSEGIETIRALVPQNDARILKYFEKAGFRTSSIINFDKPCTD
jgi:ribosomal protein S18 acetylase RimI-like enzyme